VDPENRRVSGMSLLAGRARGCLQHNRSDARDRGGPRNYVTHEHERGEHHMPTQQRKSDGDDGECHRDESTTVYRLY